MAPHDLTSRTPAVVRRALRRSAAGALLREALDAAPGAAPESAYWERTEGGEARLCRVERFTEAYAASAPLLEVAQRLADSCFGCAATLMKDKLNLKWPGGGGYRCHQDSQAYPPAVAPVLTVGIALSRSDETSGGLYVAADPGRLLPTDDRGCVADSAAEALDFRCPPLAPGDALLFSGYVPHWSGANVTEEPRALALFTFVAGDGERSGSAIRDEYYRWRAELIDGAGATSLSTIDDFSGSLLPTGPSPRP